MSCSGQCKEADRDLIVQEALEIKLCSQKWTKKEELSLLEEVKELEKSIEKRRLTKKECDCEKV